jgi:hypothetical protein
MFATFNITYEITTEESSQHGDCEERGYVVQGVSLREAIDTVRSTRTNLVDGVECIECDESPVRYPRWVTVTNGMEYETGSCESRSLHMPDHLTAATRRRIARLCGVNC